MLKQQEMLLTTTYFLQSKEGFQTPIMAKPLFPDMQMATAYWFSHIYDEVLMTSVI